MYRIYTLVKDDRVIGWAALDPSEREAEETTREAVIVGGAWESIQSLYSNSKSGFDTVYILLLRKMGEAQVQEGRPGESVTYVRPRYERTGVG